MPVLNWEGKVSVVFLDISEKPPVAFRGRRFISDTGG